MVVILMGVAGSGKTTIGRRLSEELGWKFYDADDFHPPANIDRMSRGLALDDTDRQPWLEALRLLIDASLRRDENIILACSALKESYRRQLLIDQRVKLVYLKGDFALIHERLQQRQGHFMNPSMLAGQFATLEEPEPQFHLDISPTPQQIVHAIRDRLRI